MTARGPWYPSSPLTRFARESRFVVAALPKTMKRLLLLTCVTVFAACDKGTDSGLKIQVTIASTLKTNCIALEVQKVGDGTLLASTVVARAVGDAPVAFAVRQGDLPLEVQVQAVGYSGPRSRWQRVVSSRARQLQDGDAVPA